MWDSASAAATLYLHQCADIVHGLICWRLEGTAVLLEPPRLPPEGSAGIIFNMYVVSEFPRRLQDDKNRRFVHRQVYTSLSSNLKRKSFIVDTLLKNNSINSNRKK